MTRTAFRDGSLGFWSSHPATLARRTRRWAIAGFVPLAIGLALFFAAWRFGAVTLSSLAWSWATWLPLVLALVAFGFSASITALLVGRASTVEAFQSDGASAFRLRLWTFLAGIGLVSAFAFALTRSNFLGAALTPDAIAKVRLVGHLLGTAPVFALLVYLEFAGAPVDEWGEGSNPSGWRQRLRRAYVVFGILAGYVLPMMWIDRIAYALDLYVEHLRDPGAMPSNSVIAEILRWVPGLDYDPATGISASAKEILDSAQEMIAALAILLPLACATFFVVTTAMTFLQTAAAKQRPVGASAVVRQQGYDLRPTGEAWNPEDDSAKRPSAERWVPVPAEPDTAEAASKQPSEEESDEALDEEDDEKESDPPPAWLSALREGIQSRQHLEWGDLRRATPPEASPPSDRRDLAHLFATAFDPSTGLSTLPTADQVGALEKFDRQFEDFLVAEDREGQCVFPSMDMLVTGGPGSGRTTLLLAIAMNCVVLRGQSVLILVPTPEKAELYIRRLRDVASRGGVGWHVSIGAIRSDDVRSWADPLDRVAVAAGSPAYRSPVGSLPDILVGTPLDYELHLFGSDHHRAAVRRAMLRMQVVLLEDVTTFSVQERRHLPFLIEKHRLVLASEHLPTQFLAVAPDLTDRAADYLTERLFSERVRVPVVRVRPPERTAPWLMDLAAPDPSEALEALATAGLGSKLRVVLWRPGADAADRSRLQARMGGEGRFRVVADLEELDPEEGANVDIAMYRTNTARQQTMALSSHIPGEDTVIVRVTKSGSLHAHPEPLKSLPVLPSVESEALFVSHLASAFRFLSAYTPMPRDLFARIGLRTAGQLAGVPRREASFLNFPGVSLLLDPPEPHAQPVAAARGQTWAFVAMQVEASQDRDRLPTPPPRQVELLRPLPRGRQMRIESSQDRVHLGDAPIGERSIASWATQQNEPLDRMDLAYADDLLHRHGKSLFVPKDVRDDGQGVLIRGEPFRDKDHGESFFPVLEVETFLPDSIVLDFDLGGVAPNALRWAGLREERSDSGAIETQVWLAGTFDVTGSQTLLSTPVPLHYPVRIGMILLGPVAAPEGTTPKQRDEITRASCAGRWTTRRERGQGERPRAWPVLGLALTAALREALPGLFDFCRLVAHRGPQDGVNGGRAFVHFVEPTGTRGTVGGALRKLLVDLELAEAVLSSARRSIEEVAPDARYAIDNLLVDARVLIGGGWYDATPEGEQALADDVADALRLLDFALSELNAAKQRGARVRQKRAASPREDQS